MKYLILTLFIATTFCYSCNKDEEVAIIEENIELSFNLGSGGGITCDTEYCGITIDLPVIGHYKSLYELPDSITNKFEFWNRTYIGTVKYLEDTCTCKDGDVDPMPGADPEFPTNTYPIIEILSIREK